jgi:molybdopterin molybdotransferase
VLGLPGNPVSAYVGALVFLGPLIRRLAGLSDIAVPEHVATLGRDLAENDERQDYLRSTLRDGPEADGAAIVTPLDVQDSSMMSGLARADCLLIRPPHAPPARTGDTCRIIRLTL